MPGVAAGNEEAQLSRTRSARRTIALSAAVTGTVALLLAPSPATAEPVADASCPGPAEGVNDTSGGERHAQTFTAQNAGGLTTAKVGEVDKRTSQGDFIVSINAVDGSGTPTNTVLSSTIVPEASIPAGVTTITADFATPTEVSAGQHYALVITRPMSTGFDLGFRNPDPCSGRLFFSPDQTSPFQLYPCSPNPCDMIFTVFVELPPAPKADRTLTLDTNKGKVEKGRKVRLTGQIDAPANEAACEPGQTVELQRKAKKAPDTAFSTFDSVQTDTTGHFDDKVKVKKTYVYRALVQETAACDDELSNTQKVRVQKPKAAKEA
jgi:hypothetical protein